MFGDESKEGVMFPSRLTVIVLLGVLAHIIALAGHVRAQAPAAERTFSAEEQQARQKVLDSDSWKDARRKLEDWLSVQVAYDATELEAVKRQFASRVERGSAEDLTNLLQVMQRRLDVLLSPEVAAARDWADSFYTELGKRELMEKRGLADPMAMSANDLAEALAKFAGDRQSQAGANAAFQQQQAAAVAGASEARKRQAAAAAAAASAPRQTAAHAAPYAPTRDRVQRYEAPYNPMRYSIGPWGGIWAGH
jgi:hypothetical protein